MRNLTRFVLSVVCFVLQVGCGGNQSVPGAPPPPGSPPANTQQLTENWYFPINSSGTVHSLSAAVYRDSGKFSGLVLVNDTTSCFVKEVPSGTAVQVLPFTGTIDSQRVIHASVTYNGQVLSFGGTLSADGKTLSNGSYQVTGGCADGWAGNLSGISVPALAGTFAGSMALGDEQIPVTVTLSQGSYAGTDGSFPLTGKVTIAGTHCALQYTLSGPVSADVPGSGIRGNSFILQPDWNLTDTSLQGTLDNDGMQLQLYGYPYSDGCMAGASGTLHRQ